MKNDLTELFLRFRTRNDMRALARVFDRVAPELSAVAARLARTSGEAEDLVQVTFLTAIERTRTFDASRPLIPWLLGILAMEARKLRAKAGRPIDLERVTQPAESDPEHEAARAEVAGAVDSAVRGLPEGYATIVRRHLMDGLSPTELARELGLSPINARVRLHRGLSKLRRLLPASLSGTALSGFAPQVNLSRVRGAVLQRASSFTGVPIPSAAISPVSALLMLCFAPAVVGVPAWLLLRDGSRISAGSASLAVAATVAEIETAADDELAAAESGADRTAIGPGIAVDRPSRGSGAVLARHGGTSVVIGGRLLHADGSPVAGARITLDGRPLAYSSASRETADWTNPAPVTSDVDGRYTFEVDPVAGFMLHLETSLEDHAAAGWMLEMPQAGATIDLGEASLERSGRVSVRIMDTEGKTLCSGWRVHSRIEPPSSTGGRLPTLLHARCSKADEPVVLTGAPARRILIQGVHDSEAETDAVEVDVLADQVVEATLVYSGQELDRRITIKTFCEPMFVFNPAPEHVLAMRPDADPAPASALGFQVFEISDLQPAVYDIVIDDPRFEPWSRGNVEPGATINARIRGSAALHFSVLDARGDPWSRPLEVRVRYNGMNFFPNEFTCVDADHPLPADGVLRGIVPGNLTVFAGSPGGPTIEAEIEGLQPGETRKVSLSFASRALLEGRVVASDGSTPMPGIDVQLTRGERAGRLREASGAQFDELGMIPLVDQHAISDTLGRVSFDKVPPGRWTMRAALSPWMFVDRSFEFGKETSEILLHVPPTGYLVGRVLLPEGAPLGELILAPHPASLSAWLGPNQNGRDETTLFDDGTFRFGPLPVGGVELMFGLVPPPEGGMSFCSLSSVGSYTITGGTETAIELDLRAVYPARLNARVEIDGQPAKGGSVGVYGPSGAFSMKGVSSEGVALLSDIAPGVATIEYRDANDSWSWEYSQAVTFIGGSEVALTIPILTAEREVQVVDAGTGEPVANLEIQFATGGTKQPDALPLENGRARTDVRGAFRARFPIGRVRFFLGDENTGSLDPSVIEWIASAQPILLRFSRP